MKRIRGNVVNRRACKACKSRNKRCEQNGSNSKCKFCEQRNLVCERPEFQPIIYKTPKKLKRPKYDTPSHHLARVDKKSSDITHNNLTIKQNIIINYLLFTIKKKSDGYYTDSKSSTIRSSGFSGLYRKSVQISGDVLEEIVTEIPLVDTETNIEEKTAKLYGLGLDTVTELYINVPEYLHGNDSEVKTTLSLKFRHKEGENTKAPDDLQLINVDDTVPRNEFYMEAPSLIPGFYKDDLSAMEGIFMNLPEYIPVVLVEKLIDNFCVNFPRETSKMLYAISELDNVSLTSFTKTILSVYLVLGFSNIVVLKAILLWSAYNLELNPTKKEYDFSFKIMLQQEIIEDLNNRMNYVSAVCCDHSIAILLLLYEVQILESRIEPVFWFRLNHFIVKSISLRGGFTKLEESFNGRFFRKVFCSHYFTKFCYNILKHDISVLNIEDVESVFMIPTTDHLSDQYTCLKEICHSAGKIFHFHNLLKLARNAGDLNEGNGFNKYEHVNANNIVNILNEVKEIEARLLDIVVPSHDVTDSDFDFNSMSKVLRFIKETTVILISQLIYNRTSNSPFTFLSIQELIPQLQEVFEIYIDKRVKVYAILPIFVVGCDLCDNVHRDWFVHWLDRLVAAKAHPKFLTIKLLVQKVWQINEDGDTYVAWPDLSEDNGLVLPLYL